VIGPQLNSGYTVNSKSKKSVSNWGELARLYEEAEHLSGDELSKFFESQAKTNPELVAELKEMMGDENTVAEFLSRPITESAHPTVFKAPLLPIYTAGNTIKDFEIRSVIGCGAFGTVYLAKQKSLERSVALKITANTGSEAKTMAQLGHQNIVPIYSESINETPSMRLICMSYIPGISLDGILDAIVSQDILDPISGERILDWISDKVVEQPNLNPSGLKIREQFSKFNETELVLWIGTRLCEALAYAHVQGILHLDLKPGNVIIDVYGGVYLTDFNVSLSQKMNDELRIANFGGTLDYMSPEQKDVFKAKDPLQALNGLNLRSDIFSLGMLLKRLSKVLSCSDRVGKILEKATQIDPNNRYASMKEFQLALNIQSELAQVKQQLPRASKTIGRMMRRSLLTLTIFGAVLQIIAAILGIQYKSLQVFSQLSPSQMKVVDYLHHYYTPFMYISLGTFWTWKLANLYRNFERKSDPLSINSFRVQSLKLPFWGMVMSCLGWIPSALVYPITINYLSGAIESSVLFHLLTSFTLSWLVALSYSFLLQQFLVLRFVYPFKWSVDESPSSKARLELSRGLIWARGCTALTGFSSRF